MSYEKLMGIYFGFYHKVRRAIIRKSDLKNCKMRISGKNPLTKAQKKQVADFWKPYQKVTTAYHEMYYEKTGFFSEKYIPLDIYTNVIDEFFNGRIEAKYLDNKCYYHTVFGGLKQPELVVMRCGGFWYDGNMNFISESDAQSIVAKESELFVKVATDSYGGKGVSYISAVDGDICACFNEAIKNIKGDFIAQRPVVQHERLSAINESSVNTIRIISLLTKEGVKIYSSILRMGMKGKKVDNYSSGGITIGITDEGKLKKYAYNSNGDRFDKHPSNEFVFEGYDVPGFNEAKEFVKKAHVMVPRFRLVSFDIAIGIDGEPILIEANLCKGSLEIHEFNNGPLFGDDTKKILDEVYGRK